MAQEKYYKGKPIKDIKASDLTPEEYAAFMKRSIEERKVERLRQMSYGEIKELIILIVAKCYIDALVTALGINDHFKLKATITFRVKSSNQAEKFLVGQVVYDAVVNACGVGEVKAVVVGPAVGKTVTAVLCHCLNDVIGIGGGLLYDLFFLIGCGLFLICVGFIRFCAGLGVACVIFTGYKER